MKAFVLCLRSQKVSPTVDIYVTQTVIILGRWGKTGTITVVYKLQLENNISLLHNYFTVLCQPTQPLILFIII